MKLQLSWQEKMKFVATDTHHEVVMDAKSPIGESSALSPKQLLLASICGCTGMDVISLLRKNKQNIESLEVFADAPTSEGSYPVVFTRLDLNFVATGPVDKEKLIEAVALSQSKYCGVSAMVSKAVPIFYKVLLNGTLVAEDQAKFTF